MTSPKTILVPTDFSEPAAAAWRYAQMIGARLGCRVHLVHVVSLPFFYDAWGTQQAATQLEKVIAYSEKEARAMLARLVPRKGPLAKRVTIATATGLTIQELLTYIKKHRISMVIMGTHGRGGVGHLLLGSVAERMVQQSPVPVLTVHGRAARPARKTRRAR